MTSRKLYRLLLLAVFALVPASLLRAQTYTDIHDFNETDGCCAYYPSLLAQGQDGNIYGSTTSGGVHFYGNIFKMTPSGTVTDLYDFDLTHGGGPYGGLTLGTDGNFYGTTEVGGSHSHGVAFKVTPSGAYTELYDFAGSGDGAYPRVPPVMAPDGNLYGITGDDTNAVLYKLTTSGTFTAMGTLATVSYSPLLVGTDGNLYGTTVSGGTFNAGTVFQYAIATKKVKTIYNFQTESGPYGPLMQGTDGALYGTTYSGGTGSGGVLFRITTAGVYKVLVNFVSGGVNGSRPFSGVVQGSDKSLYGVTSTGGSNGLGVLYKVSTTGTGYAVLFNFATATGDTPYSTPLLHTDGTIYGLAFHGGAHTAYGTAYSFTNKLKPFVEPVVLKSARTNTSVELLGQGLNTATGVKFGAGTGTLSIVSDTYATAKILTGATTGQITVDEPGGNLLTPLNFKITPTVKTFSPTSGSVGTTVTITGTSLTQATAVKFGTVAATFTVNSDTQITTTVPTGAVTAKISVTTPGGTATSTTTFTVN